MTGWTYPAAAPKGAPWHARPWALLSRRERRRQLKRRRASLKAWWWSRREKGRPVVLAEMEWRVPAAALGMDSGGH